MPSRDLYPPIVDKTAEAFMVEDCLTAKCRIYFSLSKASASIDNVKATHISVVKQSTGISVVKKEDYIVSDNATGAGSRYRRAGIIMLNTPPRQVEDEENLYYIEVLPDDIEDGWQPGWIYKIQIRLSSITFPGNEYTNKQANWINQAGNAAYFSEWSTYCSVKAVGKPTIKIPIFDYDSSLNDDVNTDGVLTIAESSLEVLAEYIPSNLDASELLYSYKMVLNGEGDNESSDLIYPNKIYEANQMYYLFKTLLKKDGAYHLDIYYTTINNYNGVVSFDFKALISEDSAKEIYVKTIEDNEYNTTHIHTEPKNSEESGTNTNTTTKIKYIDSNKILEEEAGVILYKLYTTETITKANICVKRSSSKDNFKIWEDIKIIPFNPVVPDPEDPTKTKTITVNDLPVYEDKTIESGIYYKYATQIIELNGDRKVQFEDSKKAPIKRDFEYSFLLGEGGRQLRLKYDNTMGSYKYNLFDSKTDTIGGKYPFITRNGGSKYRTFPINGLVSYTMDNKFMDISTDDEFYNLYNSSALEYNYKLEFDFREQVLNFLQDGKPKLFKSPTEGNIIVRLIDVNHTPNQTTDRMIGSFTSTAHEVADDNFENYIKYKFVDIGELDFSNPRIFENCKRVFYTVYKNKDFKGHPENTFLNQNKYPSQINDDNIKNAYIEHEFSNGEDIIQWLKDYFTIMKDGKPEYIPYKIEHLSLEFIDKPILLFNNIDDIFMGNNIIYNGKTITLYNNTKYRRYIFDNNINLLTDSDSIIVDTNPSLNGENRTVIIRIRGKYKNEEILKKEDDKSLIRTYRGVGQEIVSYNDLQSYKLGGNIFKYLNFKHSSWFQDRFFYPTIIKITSVETPDNLVYMYYDADKDDGSTRLKPNNLVIDLRNSEYADSRSTYNLFLKGGEHQNKLLLINYVYEVKEYLYIQKEENQ